MLDNKMPFIIEKQEKFILDEVNGYVAKMGYNIKFNKNQMVEMLKMYLNKPLEFNELKLDVPYWDNEEKSYCFFTTLNPKMKTGVKIEITNPPMICAFIYKPNRFYLREVSNES